MASNKTTLVGRNGHEGMINPTVINSAFGFAQALCPECGKVHGFNDQGLRWVGVDCGTVIFPTIDQIADAELARKGN